MTAANSRWRSGGRSEQGFWCQGGTACLAGNLVELPRQLQRLRILDESLEARLLLPIETRCRFPSCSSSRDDWGGWRCHPALIDGFHPSLAGKMSREAPCLGLFLGGMPSRTRLVRTSELRLFPEIEIQTRFGAKGGPSSSSNTATLCCFRIFTFKSAFAFKYLLSNRPFPLQSFKPLIMFLLV